MQSTRIYQLNRKLLLGFLIFVSTIISIALFFVYLANTKLDYIQCFCTLSALCSIGLCFVAMVLQRMQLLQFFESIEELINKSMCSEI